MTRSITALAAGLALAGVLLPASAVLGQDETPLPGPGTALEPGRYVSDAVGPRIAFSVEDGWQAGPAGPGPIFTLLRADEPGSVVSVTRFDGDVFVDSCDSTSLSQVEASVPRLIAVIAGNPYLNPGTPSPIEVDGHVGLSVDVATPAYTECQLEWLLIWALPVGEGNEFVQMPDQQSRFIVLDVEGDIVVVAIESLPGVPFGGLLEASLELVDTMTFEPGVLPEPDASDEPGPAGSPSPAPSGPDQPDPDQPDPDQAA